MPKPHYHSRTFLLARIARGHTIALNGARDEFPIQCNDGDFGMYSLECKQSTKLCNGIDERF